MQIISWNVASVRARLPLLLSFLKEKKPDIVFLQEIKATQETFPFQAIQELGYFSYISGQKGFNGVAILSKTPLSQVQTSFHADFVDEQARFIAATDEKHLYISVYVPNGSPPMNNPLDTTRLQYKLQWFEAFQKTLLSFAAQKMPIILGGDFNVIETDEDVYNPALFENGALTVPPVRAAFHQLSTVPLVNTIKTLPQKKPLYSYWDFQLGAFRKNWGILLDYIFVSPELKGFLVESGVYREYRAAEKPSDHAPVYCQLTEKA